MRFDYVKSVESSIMYTYFFFKKLNLTISILTIKNTIHTQFTNVINQHKKKTPTNSFKNLFFNNIYVVQEQNKI